MLGMRENPDCPLPAHASYSLTLRLRRKGLQLSLAAFGSDTGGR